MDFNPCILIQEPKILNLHIPKESGSSFSWDEMFFELRHTYVSPLFYKILLCVLLCGHMFLPLNSEYSNRNSNIQVELGTVSGVYPNCLSAIFLVSVFILFSEAPWLPKWFPCFQQHPLYPLPTPNAFSNTKFDDSLPAPTPSLMAHC